MRGERVECAQRSHGGDEIERGRRIDDRVDIGVRVARVLHRVRQTRAHVRNDGRESLGERTVGVQRGDQTRQKGLLLWSVESEIRMRIARNVKLARE